MRRLMAAVCLAIAPCPVLAQSGQIDLGCEVIAATVDGTAVVSPEPSEFAISIRPQDVSSDGSGFYDLLLGDQTFVASNLSAEGPLVWSVNPGNVTVLTIPTQDGIYVLHNYWAVSDTPSTTHYLVCEVS